MKVKHLIITCVFFWSLASLADEGRIVDKLVTDINNGLYTGIDSLLVYKHNQLKNESYFNGFDQKQLHQTRSTFKSITGLLAAIAFDQKILHPDELLLPLISHYIKKDKVDPLKAQIKVKDLLNMTSGLDCSEMPETGPYHEDMVDNGPEPLKYSLAIPMAITPGIRWKYCNANSFLLGVAVSAALHRADQPNIDAFADKYLYRPLGITHYETYQSPDGFLYTQGNARFLPRDLAKFGLLILNRGLWQGEQVVSEQHIDSVLKGAVETHWSWTNLINEHSATKSHYAFQWYRTVFQQDNISIPVIHSWGNGGQFIFVMPTLETVFVVTGSNYGNLTKQKQALEILHRYLFPNKTSFNDKPQLNK